MPENIFTISQTIVSVLFWAIVAGLILQKFGEQLAIWLERLAEGERVDETLPFIARRELHISNPEYYRKHKIYTGADKDVYIPEELRYNKLDEIYTDES